MGANTAENRNSDTGEPPSVKNRNSHTEGRNSRTVFRNSNTTYRNSHTHPQAYKQAQSLDL